MAFALAPWLQPQNFLDAIQSGAQLGLQVRRADQDQAEAAARQQQAAAQLQQNWATTMLNNQRMREQNQATRESNELYRTGMLDARNRGLDIQDARLNKPPPERNPPPGFSLNPGQTRYDATGNPLATLPPNPAKVPTEKTVSPLSMVQQEDYNRLRKLTEPVVTGFGPWKQTNAPPPLSQSDQARLQFFQNRDAALIRQNPTPNAFPLQTNSVTPSSAISLNMGADPGNEAMASPSGLATAMSLTNSPAGGTGAYRVGGLYGNMRYMGGDPNTPSSWRQE
jgi:hypothetical protein